MKTEIFRKTALDRISSPEQLDRTISVIPMYGKVVLLSLILAIAAGMIWLFTGVVPDKVYANGILMHSQGIRQISSPSSSRVGEIFFNEGEEIHKGQVIARLEALDLLTELNSTREKRGDIQKRLDQKLNYSSGDLATRTATIREKQAALKTFIATQQTREKTLEQMLVTQEKLLKDGLLTLAQVTATRNELNSVQQGIKQAQQDILDTGISMNEYSENSRTTIDDLKIQLADIDRKIDTLSENYRKATEVVASVSGTIVEILVSKGSYVGAGSPLATIEESGAEVKKLEAILFVDPANAKKVKVGQTVSIVPSVVKQEEYGTMQAVVTSVSAYPSSLDHMTRVLGNSTLARSLSGGDIAVEVHADLIPDSRTPSGYKWSSSKGPDIRIDSGYLCMGMVTVKKSHPIALILPALKKKLFGIGEYKVGDDWL